MFTHMQPVIRVLMFLDMKFVGLYLQADEVCSFRTTSMRESDYQQKRNVASRVMFVVVVTVATNSSTLAAERNPQSPGPPLLGFASAKAGARAGGSCSC